MVSYWHHWQMTRATDDKTITKFCELSVQEDNLSKYILEIVATYTHAY